MQFQVRICDFDFEFGVFIDNIEISRVRRLGTSPWAWLTLVERLFKMVRIIPTSCIPSIQIHPFPLH